MRTDYTLDKSPNTFANLQQSPRLQAEDLTHHAYPLHPLTYNVLLTLTFPELLKLLQHHRVGVEY